MIPFVAEGVLSPPFEDPILIFGLAMVVFLTAPLVLARYRLPGIVGIILVGAAIGPNGLGLLERDATIQLLGEVGLIYLMFVAGLEINLNRFVENTDRSVVFGLLSFVVPQGVGTVVGVYLLGLTVPAALLFASIFASHTLLAYPIVNRLGLAKNEAVMTTIGGTILTDTLALLVLAVVIAAEAGVLDAAFGGRLAIGLALFFVGVWIVVPRIGAWFFRTLNEESYFEFLFVMVVLFACAFLAELVGVEHIIGAFLAGLVLNRLIPETGPLMNRIEFVGNALFIPFFLLSVGMLVDVRVVTESSASVVIGGSLIVMVIVTKVAAAWLTGRIYGYSSDEVLGIFALSVGQAAAALAIVGIGFDAGVPGFDQTMINGVVLMILVVSLVSPAAMERAGRGIASERERAPYDPSEAPQRLLVPVSSAADHAERLLDVALLVRNPRTEEPIRTLSVVRPGEDAERDVADAEERLSRLGRYASGAEVAVEGQTRVDYNVASGIVRAAVENRITTVVIGWDGARSRRQRVFGDVIDQVLRRTKQLVLVARVREPLNTTDRIVVLLPPEIEHNAGFPEAIHTVNRIAEATGAALLAVPVSEGDEEFDRLLAAVEPEVPTEVQGVPDWAGLLALLRDDVRKRDLVVCVSARRDAMGWHPQLQTLPKSISTLVDGDFVVVYPASGARADDRRFLQLS
ncbi:cation:proton antiporter [Natronorarus salvus]|uniref:cation:proton antiporter n=1 Tax=Natronorarus salvus TaxID=3117733 RepID=UPI002F26863E